MTNSQMYYLNLNMIFYYWNVKLKANVCVNEKIIEIFFNFYSQPNGN